MKNYISIIVMSLVIGLAGPAELQAQESSGVSQSEIEALKAGQEAIRKELAEIKKLLQPKPKAKQVSDVSQAMDVSADPSRGSKSATLTIVEYTDYQCPFCARHVKSVMPKFIKNYVDTGKVRYVLRDFPLSFHKNATRASYAAHCAGEQGKYWEMHDKLFDNQKALGADKLPEYAKALELDVDAFDTCLASDNYKKIIETNISEGRKVGVRGTPSFVIGFSEGDQVKGTKLIRGAVGYSIFQKTVDEMLSSKK